MKPESTELRSGFGLARSGAVLLLGLVLVWLALSGHYTPWMIFLGVVSCLSVLALCLRMGGLDAEHMMQRIGWRIPAYFPWLLVQIIKANLDVTRRILLPGYRFSPSLVLIKAHPKSDVGVVTLANSITLTPGTISVRVRKGMILVHGLSKESTDELLEGEMNRRVGRLEGGA